VFCTQCGSPVGPEDRFCAGCGNASRAKAAAASVPTVGPPDSRDPATVPAEVRADAPIGRRVGAFAIDLAIVFVPLIIVASVADGSAQTNPYTGVKSYPSWYDASVWIWVIGTFCYFWLMESNRGTIGKQSLQLGVVNRETNQALTVGRACGRTAARILDGALCGLGYWWAFGAEHQAWHDKIATTRVVDLRNGSEAPTSTHPSGWYADPMGRNELRFWNGAAWTDDVATAGTSGLDPLHGSVPGATHVAERFRV
jgi:uncharacterized RDD family membrane protein YckC